MTGRRRRWGRDARVVLRAVGPQPGLWWASAGALRRMARRGWWHRAPFLPLPGEDYWRFRLETAYGGSGNLSAVLTNLAPESAPERSKEALAN